MNNTMKHRLFNLLTIIFLSMLVLVVIAGGTFSFIKDLEGINKQKNHIEYITKEVPDVISITKENNSEIIYNSETIYSSKTDKDSYIVTTKVGKYTISINKEKNKDKSFNYDMQELCSKEGEMNGKE